jgi:hypothetical protein
MGNMFGALAILGSDVFNEDQAKPAANSVYALGLGFGNLVSQRR